MNWIAVHLHPQPPPPLPDDDECGCLHDPVAHLRDPDADNWLAESWSPSDEADQSAWKTYSYRGVAVDDDMGNDIFHELVLGLLDAGEILLDDVRVVEDPNGTAVELMQNGTFETDTLGEAPARWRLVGNHGGHGRSVVVQDPVDPNNQALLLVATGATEDKHNQAQTTYADRQRVEVGLFPAIIVHA